MRIHILGCGDSGGIPRINGDWGDCDSTNPKNIRTRSSIAIAHGDENWLIDTSPDLRMQMLREKMTHIDGVFFTHAHADHILGLDELRVLYFTYKKQIPIYADRTTLASLQQIFGYMIREEQPIETPPIYPKFLIPHEVKESFEWHSMRVIPFVQNHGYSESLGYRFPQWAYSTDALHLDENAFEALAGIRLWLVDCIAYTPKPSHSHLEQTLSWIERVKPERAILIHMSKFLDYDTLKRQLPNYVEPAYDGMTIDID